MNLTKHFLNEVLQETIKEFSEKIFPIADEIMLSYIDKDVFLENAKNDKLIQQQIALGFYKDFEKEYPNFLVVRQFHKNPLNKLFGIPFKITVCFEIAKKKLKPFTKEEVKAYLKHAFAHELSHIYEEDIKQHNQKLWEDVLNIAKGNAAYGNELLAETVADMLSNGELHHKVEKQLWAIVFNRINKIKGR